jgi:hypothetical protein
MQSTDVPDGPPDDAGEEYDERQQRQGAANEFVHEVLRFFDDSILTALDKVGQFG